MKKQRNKKKRESGFVDQSLLRAKFETKSVADRLIGFREVYQLIGSRCLTGHTARELARRGQIRAVRINDRIIKYSLASVMALVEGRVDPVSPSDASRFQKEGR